jgi:hypothetical protein
MKISERWKDYKGRVCSTRLLIVSICLCLVVSVCLSLSHFYSYDFFSLETNEEIPAVDHQWANFTAEIDPEGLEHMESTPYQPPLLF